MATLAVIGLGSIGLKHAKNLLEMGHKVYGIDENIACETEFHNLGGAEVPVPFDLRECNGVVICTPSDNHLEHLFKSIATASVHTFVEKPISTHSPINVASIVSGAEERNLVLMVGNNLRLHPSVIQAKKWLDGGEIGRPLCANFVISQKNERPDYLRDGVISNWGAHELDLARYLLGPCKVMSCISKDDTIADIVLEHESGCQSAVHLDYVGWPHRRGFVINGSRGYIKCDLDRRVTWVFDGNDWKSDWRDSSWDDDYKAEMKAFLGRINGRETVGATGWDGLAVLELILEAKRMAGLT